MNLKMVIMIKTKQDLKGYLFLTFKNDVRLRHNNNDQEKAGALYFLKTFCLKALKI